MRSSKAHKPLSSLNNTDLECRVEKILESDAHIRNTYEKVKKRLNKDNKVSKENQVV